jgi:solute carrier family 25 protein 42
MQCGAFAGLVAQTVTYPIEVTRRRMQTLGIIQADTALDSLGEANAKSLCPLSTRPPTLTETIQSLYKEQGVRGFYKGVSMNWMKGPIAFSISFTTFDTLKEFLETDNERSIRLSRRITPDVVKQ